ncbi:dihydrolipoyllysine-residue acetyltransferase [Aurantivibrio infirmus]
MSKQTIVVPDIGSDDPAEVVEVCVAVGDTVEVEQSIIVLETDKASVEVPCSHAGKVVGLLVKEGDQLKTGAPILELETGSNEVAENDSEAVSAEASTDASNTSDSEEVENEIEAPEVSREIIESVPDIGGSADVEVIELCVAVGDSVEEGDSLLVLESDKASMEVPATTAGVVSSWLIKEGDKVNEGQNIVVLQTKKSATARTSTAKKAPEETKSTEAAPTPVPTKTTATQSPRPIPASSGVIPADGNAHAGPAVRKLARQLGVDLSKVKATGPRGRCTKDDVRNYVKEIVAGGGGAAIPEVPAVDFSQFGDVKKVKLSKIKKLTAANMHRSWLNVPHVTQFDDANISELESYRKKQKGEAEKRGVKLTPIPFILKACALTLRAEPSFNVSIDPDGEHMIEKDYVHIGMAVDTPIGLMVPVIRDVDKKDIWEIAEETLSLATKARDGKLTPREMKGGCFTVSSLGAIGGRGFTPIVNTPEVGILGISKAAIKPEWDGKNFVPSTQLPLCLSYDHRAVNGADAGRFLTHLVGLLADYKQLV